jgi:hypothetical protein
MVNEAINLEFISNGTREKSHMAVHHLTQMKRKQVNWIGHILLRYSLLNCFIE